MVNFTSIDKNTIMASTIAENAVPNPSPSSSNSNSNDFSIPLSPSSSGNHINQQPFQPQPKRTVSASILHSFRGGSDEDGKDLSDIFSSQLGFNSSLLDFNQSTLSKGNSSWLLNTINQNDVLSPKSLYKSNHDNTTTATGTNNIMDSLNINRGLFSMSTSNDMLGRKDIATTGLNTIFNLHDDFLTRRATSAPIFDFGQYSQQDSSIRNNNTTISSVLSDNKLGNVYSSTDSLLQSHNHNMTNKCHDDIAAAINFNNTNSSMLYSQGSSSNSYSNMLDLPAGNRLHPQQQQQQQMKRSVMQSHNIRNNNVSSPIGASNNTLYQPTAIRRSAYSSPNLIQNDNHHPRASSTQQQQQRQRQQQQQMQQQMVSHVDANMIEEVVINSCKDILREAANNCLKAVELANTLRARVGIDILATVRETWGGLLTLLEQRATHIFRVDRIPKNDLVTLIDEGDVDITSSSSGNGISSLYQPHDISSNQNSKRITSSTGSIYDNSNKVTAIIQPLAGNKNQNNNRMRSPVSIGVTSSSVGVASNSEVPQMSKCLHVGNVNANISEEYLTREFERFGNIDSLTIVSQKNRRFAFITFRTVEQALRAKQAMSRVHPWKNAISFSHKETNGTAIASGSNANIIDGNYMYRGANYINNSLLNPNDISYNHYGMLDSNASSGNDTFTSIVHSHPIGSSSFNDYDQSKQQTVYYNNSNAMLQQGYSNNSSEDINDKLLQQHNYSSNDGDNSNNNSNSDDKNNHFHTLDNSMKKAATLQAYSTVNYITNDSVITRLCDDTYVPTQLWPVDIALDSPYVNAIIAQLQQFNGCTTISKLRGFLRNRVSASNNIKSVPLKSFLAAYPDLFTVHNNQVYLLSSFMP